jgi:RNA polymerase II subunit A-like phosphatase
LIDHLLTFYQSRTAKVRTSAARYPHIKIVSPQWLYNSISNWQKEPEEPYLIDIHPEDRPMANGVDDSRLGSMSSDDEEFEDMDDEEMQSTQTDDGFLPDDLPDMANVGWMEVDEEFKEWIGSDTDWLGSDDEDDEDNDDDDDYGEGGDGSALSNNNNGKRARGTTPPSGGLEGDATPESRLSKRQKVSRERPASALRNVEASASNPNSASPSPGSNGTTLDGTTEGDDDPGEDEGGEDHGEESDDLEAEFERELVEAMDAELAARNQRTENDDGGGDSDAGGTDADGDGP